MANKKLRFQIPKGGYYRVALKIMPIDGGQPQEYTKVLKATSWEEAQDKFNEWLDKEIEKETK